ncbi:MAG TPA: S8 family serine peptidase, partial [Pyrinomonadaceae bacterium]
MTPPQRTHHAARLAAFFALLALFVTLSPARHAGASVSQAAGAPQTRADNDQRDRGKVSPDLKEKVRGAGDAPVGILLQLNGPAGERLNAVLNRAGVHVRGRFEHFNSAALDLPASAVEELAALPEVELVAADRPVEVTGHVNTTTGVEAVRAQTTATGAQYSLDGTGIGVAVIDSGVYASHESFLNASGVTRVAASVDFTGYPKTVNSDIYGHGTHVAGLAAGDDNLYGATYNGVAPNARLINLKVLDDYGKGTASQLLSALNWVMTNRTKYNIRVVNLSLGTAAIDSYKNDPLCKAVRSLVNAGVVVVAAAGNDGKNSAGQKVYGRIHSPGNEPSAITVGASNTFGTDARADDTVTTFSSRGPTRSYWT